MLSCTECTGPVE